MREMETTFIVNSKAYTWLSLYSSVAGLWYLALAGEEQTTRYNKTTHYKQVGDLHRARPHPIQSADLFAAPHVTNIYLAAPNTIQFCRYITLFPLMHLSYFHLRSPDQMAMLSVRCGARKERNHVFPTHQKQ